MLVNVVLSKFTSQLLALKTFKQNATLKKIKDMKEHEREHYEYFDNEIKRNIKPTKLPLWISG